MAANIPSNTSTQTPITVTTTLALSTLTQTPPPGEAFIGVLSGTYTTILTITGKGSATVQYIPYQIMRQNEAHSDKVTLPTTTASNLQDTLSVVSSSSSQKSKATKTKASAKDSSLAKPAASTSSGTRNGAAPGTVAGAAIGAAIGAGIFAFLIALWLFRRKRRYDGAAGAGYQDEKSAPKQHPWEVYMPQSADDSTIQSAVETLYSQIDLHVENFYGKIAHANISDESRTLLRRVDGGILPRPAEELLVESDTPIPVIKHCFAWAILSNLSPTADGRQSLLPADMARLPAEQRISKSRHEREDKAMMQAYNYWRVLTAQLLYPKSRGAIPDAPGKPEVLDTLTTAFSPWSSTNNGDTSAQEHLESVLKTATATGLLVASQPSLFAFVWDVIDHHETAAGSTAVVTAPMFGKTADEFGNTLPRVQILVRPRMETLV